ncbi:hypothetical protein NQZ79_g6597 [Umbelopsis isabellina]|nr:hypothetical protein NQZ79_g6597 [Umbelopsis isabellina]
MQNQNALGEIVLPAQATSAIPIVAPSTDTAAVTTNPKSPTLKPAPATKAPANAGKRLCRNIIIHGYCKFEGKGCEFNHEVRLLSNEITFILSPFLLEKSKPKLRVNSPAFKPSTPSSVSADAPVFVPKAAGTYMLTSSMQFSYADINLLSDASLTSSAAAFQSDQQFDPNVRDYVPNAPYFPAGPPNQAPTFAPSPSNVASITNNFSQFGFTDSPSVQNELSPMAAQATPQGRPFNGNMFDPNHMDPYYYQNPPVYTQQPLQHHLYSSPLPHVTNLHPHQKSIHAFFMSDNLREELTERNEALLKTAPDLNLPQELHVYHSLYPLDFQQEKSTQVFGHPTSVYKAMCTLDGRPYVLRRIEGFRLMNEVAMSTIESWRRIRHANVVSVREAFTTKAFGDHSLVFVYDYHPCSKTLFEAHFTNEAQQTGGNISEKIIWSYITQITSALKTIHTSGLAARMIEPTKILLTGKNRIRLNCCGALDTIKYDGGQNLARFQQEDLLSFGKLIVALACNSLQAIQNLPNSFEYISHFYSPDLKNVILYLISKPMPSKSIDEVISLIGPKILHEIDSAHHHSDFLESELSRELENGRLFRLLMKINFINERPEFDMDPSWSETGDRYIIKLFRDYVFHQVNENGAPALDMVHVLTCLNKNICTDPSFTFTAYFTCDTIHVVHRRAGTENLHSTLYSPQIDEQQHLSPVAFMSSNDVLPALMRAVILESEIHQRRREPSTINMQIIRRGPNGSPVILTNNFGSVRTALYGDARTLQSMDLFRTSPRRENQNQTFSLLRRVLPAEYVEYLSGQEDQIIQNLLQEANVRNIPPAASDDTISKLPKLVIKSKNIGKLYSFDMALPLLSLYLSLSVSTMDFNDFPSDELQPCAVCTEDYVPQEEALKLPCSHIFHQDCIVPWLRMNQTCPVCRFSVESRPSSSNSSPISHISRANSSFMSIIPDGIQRLFGRRNHSN